MFVKRNRHLPALAALALLLALGSSCAYYNTFYLARKYYMKATDGQPYEIDRDNTTQRSNYSKSADYAKKLLGVYPRSKYVDDAWLLWAKTLLGTDDPLKAVAMLQEFETRFPKSDLRPDAEFFLGLAYRSARKYEQAVAAFDEFLAQAPKHPLVPYAYYERSKALLSLQKYKEAAESAGQVLERFPRHPIYDRALSQRAESRYQQQDYTGARADFHELGNRALTDDDRMRLLLREVDCLEAARNYDEARALLHDARSHVLAPPPLPAPPRVGVTSAAANNNTSTNGDLNSQQQQALLQQQQSIVRTPEQERYGRLTLRMGGVELLGGHVDQSVELYNSVLKDYPRSQLAAEAQYRIGYAYETGADDFERARSEYGRVKEQVGVSQFAQQAQARLDNLDRIDRYRQANGQDSLARKAEARFLIAEHYLFNLERPERALDEYRAIFDSASTPAIKARALTAEAWLLSRKLNRKSAADSLYWTVVQKYPATEAQLAARDYLEAEGQVVSEKLIVPPKEVAKPILDEPLTQPPAATPKLGTGLSSRPLRPGIDPSAIEYGPGANPALAAPDPMRFRGGLAPDSIRRAIAHRDSLFRRLSADTSAVGRARLDSLRYAYAHPDTAGNAANLARIQNEVQKPVGVVVAPDTTRAPKPFSSADTLQAPPDAAASPGRGYLPPPPRLDMAQSLFRPVTTMIHPDTTSGAGRRNALHILSAPAARVYTGADSLQQRARDDSLRAAELARLRDRVRADSLRAIADARDKAQRDSLAHIDRFSITAPVQRKPRPPKVPKPKKDKHHKNDTGTAAVPDSTQKAVSVPDTTHKPVVPDSTQKAVLPDSTRRR